MGWDRRGTALFRRQGSFRVPVEVVASLFYQILLQRQPIQIDGEKLDRTFADAVTVLDQQVDKLVPSMSVIGAAPWANAASMAPFAKREVATMVPRTALNRYSEPRRASRSLRCTVSLCRFA